MGKVQTIPHNKDKSSLILSLTQHMIEVMIYYENLKRYVKETEDYRSYVTRETNKLLNE